MVLKVYSFNYFLSESIKDDEDRYFFSEENLIIFF